MIPTRAALAIVATIAGVVMLVSFKTPDARPERAQRVASSSPVPSDTPVLIVPNVAPATATPSPTPVVLKDGRYTGDDVPNPYGDVEVQINVAGGRITAVDALRLPSDLQHSAELSQYAAPILHDEVLRAQSSQIDAVNGATYTSDGYAQSLQAALDKATE
jgi:uncharacterized protein with FMN-binding domain